MSFFYSSSNTFGYLYDGFDGYDSGDRYANRAEKSAAAQKREDEAKDKFNYLRGQMEVAYYENTMTLIGLACLPKSTCPLKLLSTDLMSNVLSYANIKPRGNHVNKAVEGRSSLGGGVGTTDIIPYAGWRDETKKKKKSEDDTDLNLADFDTFETGEKLIIPLAMPNLYLTGACYRDLRQHIKSFPRWDVKRTPATTEQKKAYKEQRKGTVYFINAIYNNPGKKLTKKQKRKRDEEREEAAAKKVKEVVLPTAALAMQPLPVPSVTMALPQPVESVFPPVLTMQSANPYGGWGNNPGVTVTINKPKRDTKIGISISLQKDTSNVVVTKICPGTVFAGSGLRVGMALFHVNGRGYTSFNECRDMILNAVGRVTIFAGFPSVQKPVTSAAMAATMAPSFGASTAVAKPLPSVSSMLRTPPTVTSSAAISQSSVTIVVTKPSEDTKLGLGISREPTNDVILIGAIHPGSLFEATELRVGMIVELINSKKYSTFDEGLALLKAAEGELSLVATKNVQSSK